MSTTDRISELIVKRLDGSIVESEYLELEQWILLSEENEQLVNDFLTNPLKHKLEVYLSVDEARMWEKDKPISAAPIIPMKRRRYGWYGVWAAAILVCVFLSLYNYVFKVDKPNHGPTEIGQSKAAKDNITPGSLKARLKLGNGDTILLGGEGIGKVGDENGIIVTDSGSGTLVYAAKDDDRKSGYDLGSYNVLEIPRGGQYHLQLSDGTGVWLNAESSLRYPSHFPASERVVELQGEGYFEVTKKTGQTGRIPFKVKVGDITVNVLGTRFNINSYKDEPAIRTSLVEGSVLLTKGTSQVYLEPGYEAAIRGTSNKFETRKIDTAAAIDWKNGSIIFRRDPIEVVMRKVGRWYNVDFAYVDVPLNKYGHLTAELTRTMSIENVLKVIAEATDNEVEFKITGRQILVSRKK